MRRARRDLRVKDRVHILVSLGLRQNNLRKLTKRHFDVLILGAGINGAVSAAAPRFVFSLCIGCHTIAVLSARPYTAPRESARHQVLLKRYSFVSLESGRSIFLTIKGR